MLAFSKDPELAEQQMRAIIFYLAAFGYIDGEFDLSEKTFIRIYIRQLIEHRAKEAMPTADSDVRDDVIKRWVTHFHEVFEEIDHDVRSLFTEVVGHGEKLETFVYAKLKLRSYEIFRSFDEDNQLELLATCEELIGADGKIHPEEVKFRDEVRALLQTEEPMLDGEPLEGAGIVIEEGQRLEPRVENHPFFTSFESHYSSNPEKIKKQAAADLLLIEQTMEQLDAQRAGGNGKLAGHQTVGEFAGQAPFLDGHVFVHPLQADRKYELIILGDLHGCYSCLKAALMQCDFFAKVEAFRLDPKHNPDPKLVLLGDYIDRGRFSYNGVLRTVMQLYNTAPDHVYPLRGNHEYYLEYQGRIYGGVRPAEAINTLINHMPQEMFESYMKMFESLPNVLLFDEIMFVHAGIPRDADMRERWRDLSTLNDPDMRFQMLWSDPSAAEFIPDELQAENARFPFGRRQFEAFMTRIGCKTLVRGHEKVVEGFRNVYAEAAGPALLNVFSAGGKTNDDLPEDSSYRDVTPMALTMTIDGDERTVRPWEIDYARYNDPSTNAFFATPPEIQHKTE